MHIYMQSPYHVTTNSLGLMCKCPLAIALFGERDSWWIPTKIQPSLFYILKITPHTYTSKYSTTFDKLWICLVKEVLEHRAIDSNFFINGFQQEFQ
jgi:hypothetical protein